MKKIQIIISVIIGIVTLIGIVFSAEQYFAKDKAVKNLEMRVDHKILQDGVSGIQERLWKIEDRYDGDCSKMSQEMKEEYRRLQKEKEFKEKQLDIIMERLDN